jgi:hypothetical protein
MRRPNAATCRPTRLGSALIILSPKRQSGEHFQFGNPPTSLHAAGLFGHSLSERYHWGATRHSVIINVASSGLPASAALDCLAKPCLSHAEYVGQKVTSPSDFRYPLAGALALPADQRHQRR